MKGRVRPVDKFTYYNAVRGAIQSYPGGQASASMIYSYLSTMFPGVFRMENRRRWEGTVRATLSRHPEFVKIYRPPGAGPVYWEFWESAVAQKQRRLMRRILGTGGNSRESCFAVDWASDVRSYVSALNGNSQDQNRLFSPCLSGDGDVGGGMLALGAVKSGLRAVKRAIKDVLGARGCPALNEVCWIYIDIYCL